MTKNRRFPFQRTEEQLLVDNVSTTEEQLYPIIRQYASVCRPTHPRPRCLQPEVVQDQDNSRLNDFINYLKQDRDVNNVDRNNFSALRENNIQHWKHVKHLWQKYYHEEMIKQQEIFANLLKTPPSQR